MKNSSVVIEGNNNGVVNINGKNYDGNDVSIVGNKVVIDGEIVDTIESKNIDIKIEGNVGNITTSTGDIVISGDVKGKINNTTGDISIGGDVDGNVNTVSGSIECGEIKSGEVMTVSGSITRL